MDQIDIKKLIEQIEYAITKVIMTEVQSGAMSDAESRDIAGYVLDTTPALQTAEQVDAFLKTLMEKWPAFTQISKIKQMQMTDVTETQTALDKVHAQLAAVTP